MSGVGALVVPRVRRKVPQWADWAAQATMWCALPSCIWRILFALGLPAGFTGSQDPQNDPIMLPYVVVLAVLTEALAFLSMGLVRPWGEIWPWWVPGLRGKRIPPLVAIVPAALGSVALTLLWTTMVVNPPMDNSPEMPQGAKAVILYICYLPLVVWGPLLAAVTVAYAVRRRRYG